MGIGSTIKRGLRKADKAAREVKDDPFSSNSLKTGASLAIGVPLPIGETRSLFSPVLDLPGLKDTYNESKFYTNALTQQADTQNRSQWESRLFGKNSWFDGDTWKKNEDTVIIAGTAVGVILICIYASAFCSYAVTLGAGVATAKLPGVLPGGRKKDPNGLEGAYPDDTIVGDSGGDNSGFGDSWDLNTPAGRKSWAIALGAVAGAVALFYTVRYLRK